MDLDGLEEWEGDSSGAGGGGLGGVGRLGGPEIPADPELPEDFEGLEDLEAPGNAGRSGRPPAPPSLENFRERPEQYLLKSRVFELLGDVSRGEIARRLKCSPTSLSHYVTDPKWWPREDYDRLVAVAVELRGGADDELLGLLEEAFSAAEQEATPAVHQIGRLKTQIEAHVQELAVLREERDALLQQSAAASGEDQEALLQRISELEEELRTARRAIGRLKKQLVELQLRLAASGDPGAALEAARCAAGEVARLTDPAERRERALEAVSELDRPDGVGEFIGQLRTRVGAEDAMAVLEDIVQNWSPARVADLFAVLDAGTDWTPAASHTSAAEDAQMRAQLSSLYRQITKSDLRVTALRLLDADAFAGVIQVLHAQGAARLAQTLLAERVKQRTVDGAQHDAYALQERAQSYVVEAVWRPPQEIADLVSALRSGGQDHYAALLLDIAGGLLPDAAYEQLENRLTAAGRINDWRSLRGGRVSDRE
ncbi:hypothetical protein ABZ445_36405 [Streptomyces chartreusis]|uniref:hypothetical protein n=1 Tax=Streptomyces chartreusis TaxID=1969 RepID=UPI0033EA1EF0